MRSRLLPVTRSLALLLIVACGRAPAEKADKTAKPAPYTVAIVFCGWEIWIGNDQIRAIPADDPSRHPGALNAIAAGLDKADLAHTAPAGSQGMIVVYADRPMIRIPTGPIANLTGEALGTQKDYYGMIGVELVGGVVLAVDQLEKAPAGQKLLVVLSDGNDTNNEQAKVQLAALKKRVATLGIEVTSIVYKSALSGDGNVIAALTDHTEIASSADALTAAVVHALGHPGS
jgi:hypothetical protein